MRFSSLTAAGISILILTLLAPTAAQAWGPLGHRMIAENAALLIEKAEREHQKSPLKSPPEWGGWGAFLARHRFELGYYSIIPDSHYRANDGKGGKTEAPCHFFDIDLVLKGPYNRARSVVLQKEIDQFPADFTPAQARLKEILPAQTDPLTLGTAPWRTEQMMNRVWNELNSVKSATGTYQSGKTSTGDARKIYDALTDLGVMSHYTGDAAMPHHATHDWNGYDVGHGGIHFYFENDCVNVNEPGVSEEVLKLAWKNREKWLKEWKVAERRPSQVLLAMFLDSAEALTSVIDIDTKHAVITPGPVPSGVAPTTATPAIATDPVVPKKKIDAIRKDAHLGCQKFRPLVIERLAKAVVLTAAMWERVLPKGVNFDGPTPLKFSDFEFYTGYIQPDYSATEFVKATKP